MFKDNRCYEDEVNINIDMNDNNNFMKNDKNMNYNPGMEMGYGCAPIVEMPCERVINREICHNVEHIQPINTRIINHHIYHHTFKPCYTCCEENDVCNIYDQNPCCR